MKTLRAISVSCGAAILLFGASARPTSAGDAAQGWGLSWGSYARAPVNGGIASSDVGSTPVNGGNAPVDVGPAPVTNGTRPCYGGPCGYGACGPEGCGYGAIGGCNWPPMDYARYIVGHGPMYPGGERSTGYSYMKGPSSTTPPALTPPPAPLTPPPVPNAMAVPNGR